MRGRKPAGPESVDELPGSEMAKDRLKTLLQTMMGECRVIEACQHLSISEPRYHQLKHQMLAAALEALEPRPAGRPVRVPSEAEKEIEKLQNELRERETELNVATVREEIALILPRVAKTATRTEKKNGNDDPPTEANGTSNERLGLAKRATGTRKESETASGGSREPNTAAWRLDPGNRKTTRRIGSHAAELAPGRCRESNPLSGTSRREFVSHPEDGRTGVVDGSRSRDQCGNTERILPGDVTLGTRRHAPPLPTGLA